jgi:hypothetical protein
MKGIYHKLISFASLSFKAKPSCKPLKSRGFYYQGQISLCKSFLEYQQSLLDLLLGREASQTQANGRLDIFF